MFIYVLIRIKLVCCVCSPEKLNKKFSVHYEFGDRRELVTSARTYFYHDEHVCDANVENFIDGINTVSGTASRCIALLLETHVFSRTFNVA